jgi:hypothetical protein
MVKWRIAMNGFWSNAIARVTSFVKMLRLKQALIVTLVGLLVITTTACNGGDPRMSNNVGANQGSYGASPYDKNDGPTRELYKPVQKREGGMNNYNDDPRYDRDETKVERDKMVQRAEKNLERRATNPQDVFSNIKNENPLDDKARATSDSLKSSTDKLVNDFSEGTRKGTRNLQENLDRAGDSAPRVLNEAKRNTAGAVDDVREGTEAILQGGKNVINRAGEVLQDKAGDAANAVGDRF